MVLPDQFRLVLIGLLVEDGEVVDGILVFIFLLGFLHGRARTGKDDISSCSVWTDFQSKSEHGLMTHVGPH